VLSGGYHAPSAWRVWINSLEQTVIKGRGLNFVLIDHINGTILNSASFDTHAWADGKNP